MISSKINKEGLLREKSKYNRAYSKAIKAQGKSEHCKGCSNKLMCPEQHGGNCQRSPQIEIQWILRLQGARYK